ncbi:unnamed protein product [Closterium sp. NIES-64]|nr:unnamed protein product [Closterium sp. NIES-64]
MLYVVGVGLWDESDITVRGLAAVRRCQHVFLEAYTSMLLVDKAKLVRTAAGAAGKGYPLDVPYGHPSLRVHLFRRSCFLLSSLLPPSFSHAPHFLFSPLLPPRPPGLGGQEALYGREVRVADREMVESRAGDLLHLAAKEDVAFLVVGDPFGCVPRMGAAMCGRMEWIVHQGQGAARAGTFLHKRVELRGGCKALPVGKWSAGPLEPCATTHTDLMLRARQQGVAVSVVHNASVLNAVGATGLQLYRFGETVSIPFFTDTWQPDSFYDRILGNAARDLHTLCLLDIKVKEPSLEAMARGRIEYEAPRYMSVNTAICQLLLVEEKRHQQVCTPDSLCVGVARLGADSQCIVFGSMQQLSDVDLGPPLHSLVLCGALHELERDFLDAFKVTDATPRIVEGSEGSEEEESERPILVYRISVLILHLESLLSSCFLTFLATVRSKQAAGLGLLCTSLTAGASIRLVTISPSAFKATRRRAYAGEEVEEWHVGDSEHGNIGNEGKAAPDATTEMEGDAEATYADANADVAGTKPRPTAAKKGKVQLGGGSSKGTRGKANVNKGGGKKDPCKGKRGKAITNEGCSKGDGGYVEAGPCSDEDYAEAAGPLPTYPEQ